MKSNGMREDVNTLGKRVTDIEKEPVDEYKDIKKNIRTSVVSFVVGAIIAALGTIIFK